MNTLVQQPAEKSMQEIACAAAEMNEKADCGNDETALSKTDFCLSPCLGALMLRSHFFPRIICWLEDDNYESRGYRRPWSRRRSRSVQTIATKAFSFLD